VLRAESVIRCDRNFVPVLEKKKIQFTIQNIHKVQSLWIEEDRNIGRKPSGITVQNMGNQARKLASKV
jgi:hypothetical protein